METNIEIGNEHYLVEEGSQLHGLIQGVNYIHSNSISRLLLLIQKYNLLIYSGCQRISANFIGHFWKNPGNFQ